MNNTFHSKYRSNNIHHLYVHGIQQHSIHIPFISFGMELKHKCKLTPVYIPNLKIFTVPKTDIATAILTTHPYHLKDHTHNHTPYLVLCPLQLWLTERNIERESTHNRPGVDWRVLRVLA